MKLTWKDLPTEILHCIFGFVHNETESDADAIFCCALVCKAWEIPARYVLYSNIGLILESDLDSLANTVENNQDLAQLVKVIELNVDLDPDVFEHPNLERLLANLPNLEILSTTFVRSEYFAPLLHVLLDRKLPQLKRIPSPTYACPIADAAACILLLKDRLEKLELNMDKSHYASDYSYGATLHRLYNRLYFFKNLNELTIIKKQSNCEIGLMEDITTRCKSLTKLELAFADIDELSEPNPRTTTCVTGYTPQPNIKYLCNIGQVLDLTLYLSYIIHKFPQLEALALCVDVIDKWKGLSDSIVISKVMDYLSNIRNIKWASRLIFNSNSLYDVTESYMKSSINTKQQLEYITFIYRSHINFKGDDLWLEKINNVQMGTNINFYRLKHDALSDLDHTRFLENYGSRYKHVKIGGLKNCLPMIHDEQIKDLVRGDILIHTLTHCPNLEVLTLSACLLEKINISSSQELLAEKLKLNSLQIDECIVHEDMLRQLSIEVSEIKYLKLSKNAYLFKDGHRMHLDTVNILSIMEFTKIGTLEIDIDSSHYFENRYLYLSKVMQGQSKCYYKFDLLSRIFLPCSKQEFDQRIGLYSHEPRIFINFHHVEKIVITYDELVIIKFES